MGQSNCSKFLIHIQSEKNRLEILLNHRANITQLAINECAQKDLRQSYLDDLQDCIRDVDSQIEQVKLRLHSIQQSLEECRPNQTKPKSKLSLKLIALSVPFLFSI